MAVSSIYKFINMRKPFLHQRHSSPRRSNTIANKSQADTHPEELRFFVGSGNNGQLVRRVLSTRSQWKETVDAKEMFVNLRWQQSNRNYKYENCIDNRIFKHCLNHFEYHHELSNKETLFRNLQDYCEHHKLNVFQFVPLTFVLNLLDSSFQSAQAQFLSFYQHADPRGGAEKVPMLALRRRRGNPNHVLPVDSTIHSHFCKYQIGQAFESQESPYLWILKPTSYNRGNGVHVFSSLQELETLMNKYIQGYVPPTEPRPKPSSDQMLKKSFRIRESSSHFSIRSSSFVIQKYMERPLLFGGRKFDIRMWVLVTHQLKVFLFRQGYLRTSSYQFTLTRQSVSNLNIHLTNNAVQKYNQHYGRYELGNQLSFDHLKALLIERGKSYDDLLGMIKAIVKITALSVRRKINKQERNFCFQVFGYDFMLDEECQPYLIEVNTNPCIEESSPVLQQLLPRMLDDAFLLTIDKIFPSRKQHSNFSVSGEHNHDNLWDFIVDLRKS